MLHKSLFKSFGLRFGQGEGLVNAWCIQAAFYNHSLNVQLKAGLEILLAFTPHCHDNSRTLRWREIGKFSSPSLLPSCLEIFICNALDVLPT